MITNSECMARYGACENEAGMVVWHVPVRIIFGRIPDKIYCNRDLVKPLELALSNIVGRGLQHHIKTWDGCFNIRKVRGKPNVQSIHSYGLAVDINASENKLGEMPTMPRIIVQCFEDAGFEWGGDWKRPDGMHFQLAKLPEKKGD